MGSDQDHLGTIVMVSVTSIILTFHRRPFRFFRPGKDEYPEVAYEDVMAKDEAMLRWLDNIVGFLKKALTYQA